MVDIPRYTNLHLRFVKDLLVDGSLNYHKDLSSDELNAFFGILVLTSITKPSRKNITSVCSDVTGRTAFRAAMSLN